MGRKKVKMNMNDKILDMAIANVESKKGKKVDYSGLPELTAAQATIHPFKNKRVDGGLEISGYAVYVQVHGKWRHINEVYVHMGYKTVAPAQTKEQAEKTLNTVLTKWGKAEVKKERKGKKMSQKDVLAALAAAQGITVDEMVEIAKAYYAEQRGASEAVAAAM